MQQTETAWTLQRSQSVLCGFRHGNACAAPNTRTSLCHHLLTPAYGDGATYLRGKASASSQVQQQDSQCAQLPAQKAAGRLLWGR